MQCNIDSLKIDPEEICFYHINLQQDVRTKCTQRIKFRMSLPKNVDRNTDKYNEDATNADHGKHPVVEYSNI